MDVQTMEGIDKSGTGIPHAVCLRHDRNDLNTIVNYESIDLVKFIKQQGRLANKSILNAAQVSGIDKDTYRLPLRSIACSFLALNDLLYTAGCRLSRTWLLMYTKSTPHHDYWKLQR